MESSSGTRQRNTYIVAAVVTASSRSPDHRPARIDPGEVHHRRFPRQRHRHAHRESRIRTRSDSVALQTSSKRYVPARQFAQRRPHHAFAVILQARACCAATFASPYFATSSRNRSSPAADRHQLRHQVAFALHRSADVRQHQPQQLAIDLPGALNQHRRNAQSLPDKSRAPAAWTPDSCRRHRRDARDSPGRTTAACGRASNTGATAVISGRCVPPRNGSFTSATSPGPQVERIAHGPHRQAAWRPDAPACDRPWPPSRRARRRRRRNNRGAP